MKRSHWVLMCVALFMLTFVAGSAAAQDAVKVAPNNFKVLLDNEHVRVLEFTGKPGEKVGMHSHPPYIVYAIAGGKTRHTTPDGKTSERESKPGAATWVDAETHASEVVGPGAGHAILVEMKQAKPAPPKPPAKKS